jgi:hypothetical protein
MSLKIMSVQKRYDVFLSHNSKDKLLVEILAERFREAAIEVWLDKDNLQIGDSLPEEIPRAIQNSKAVVFCIGEHGLGKWHKQEMNECIRLKVDERLKCFVVLLPPIENLPEDSCYGFLQNELHCKWDDNPETINKLITSIFQWFPVWRDKELIRLTQQRKEIEQELKEIEQNIQQVEREIGTETDPFRLNALEWFSTTRKKVELHIERTLRNFPELEKQIKGKEDGFDILVKELDSWLEFIYFAFRCKNQMVLDDIDIDYSELQFESNDSEENYEMYCNFLNEISNSIDSVSPERINRSTKEDLKSHFNYFCAHVLPLYRHLL